MFDNLDLRNQFFTVNITIILNSSVPGAARRKMNRPEAKAGGFEALYRVGLQSHLCSDRHYPSQCKENCYKPA